MKILTARQLDFSHIAGPWACELSYLESFIDRSRSFDFASFEAESRAKVLGEPLDPWAPPTLYERTDSGVALISLSGPITKQPNWMQRWYGGTSSLQVRKAIDTALADPQVQAIIVVADTPGGMHAGTSELAATIRGANSIKPCWTYAEDMACSAGLWALAGGARVFANEAAVIGSIGTYLVIWDSSAAFAAAGVKVHVISSAPPIKGSGVAGTEVVPEQLAAWKKTVLGMSAIFERSLAGMRGLGFEDVHALATGDIWSAEESKSYGLIDAVLPLADVIDLVRKEKLMSKSTTVATPVAAASTPADPATAPVAAAPAAAEPTGTPVATATPSVAATANAAPPAPVTIAAEELAALRARAERAEADAAAARASAATLEQAERTRRFAGHASRLGLPAAMANVLDRVEATMGAEVFSAIETAFAAKHTQAAQAIQFSETGTAAPPANEGSAMNQLQAIAKQMVADKKAPDYATALSLAAQQNPGLADQTRPSGT